MIVWLSSDSLERESPRERHTLVMSRTVRTVTAVVIGALMALVGLVASPASAATPFTQPGLAAGWQDPTHTAVNAAWYTNIGATNGANRITASITPSPTLTPDCSLTYLQYRSRTSGWMALPKSVGTLNCTATSVSATVNGMPTGYQARIFTVLRPNGTGTAYSAKGVETDYKVTTTSAGTVLTVVGGVPSQTAVL